ncbi:hypothetical protein BU26DRAFT_127032 [Trematosphaeria pertusa]|uniref:Uncharacterized protein n=1 Tax=Trematosphaeria pertusa TaxID=390896 RepID=A0A6A6I0P3_9PLEO|nr:uncharacterized protein BU26DRAFT_127032 [Trematosphaeria pertusa]KAF2243140.1 hypothetical protein BU26DRAFT_127032 [Trematosphaeria pertusa]
MGWVGQGRAGQSRATGPGRTLADRLPGSTETVLAGVSGRDEGGVWVPCLCMQQQQQQQQQPRRGSCWAISRRLRTHSRRVRAARAAQSATMQPPDKAQSAAFAASRYSRPGGVLLPQIGRHGEDGRRVLPSSAPLLARPASQRHAHSAGVVGAHSMPPPQNAPVPCL